MVKPPHYQWICPLYRSLCEKTTAKKKVEENEGFSRGTKEKEKGRIFMESAIQTCNKMIANKYLFSQLFVNI